MRSRYSAPFCAALLLLSLAAALSFAFSAKAQITPEVARVAGFPVMFVDTLAGKYIGRHNRVSARLCWRDFG